MAMDLGTKEKNSSSHRVVPDMSVYRRYRAAARALCHKIMEAVLDKKALQHTGEALGLMERDDLMIFDGEGEINVLMDYALYEHEEKGKNAVERYQEEVGGETPIERELLAAMVASSTSLFRVEATSRETYCLRLVDLVHENRTTTLMDINFSQQMSSDYLLFIRPITLDNFSMTSGFAFIFPGYLEGELIKRWREAQLGRSRRLQRRRGKQSTSARRYATFFKLSKHKGIEVRYENVDEKRDG